MDNASFKGNPVMNHLLQELHKFRPQFHPCYFKSPAALIELLIMIKGCFNGNNP